MTHWLRLHYLAFLATLRLLAANPLGSLFNLLVIGIAVALPLGLYTLVSNLQGMAGQLPTEPQASIFLQAKATTADINRIKSLLASDANVKQSRHIDKTQALKDLEQTSGMGDLLAGLGNNPLPDSFELTLKHGDANALAELNERLKADPAVEHIQLDSEWAQRLSSIVSLGHEAAITVAGLFGAALLLITANLIRMQILTRREEIEVSKLIGATNSFIRRPFLYLAAVQGVLGSLIGIGLVAAGLSRLNGPVAQLAGLYGQSFQLSLPAIATLALSLLCVAALSLAGASLSVRKHLRLLDA
ncbi:permease-like cell division protein FtsX [Chitinimonas sp. PSY-7]|uniref:permease-like cell division protein FtsX n=1 Tax=Chitinimonas sp. PSY-7 TaxID=3459088 RepID=UPI0040400AF8